MSISQIVRPALLQKYARDAAQKRTTGNSLSSVRSTAAVHDDADDDDDDGFFNSFTM